MCRRSSSESVFIVKRPTLQLSEAVSDTVKKTRLDLDLPHHTRGGCWLLRELGGGWQISWYGCVRLRQSLGQTCSVNSQKTNWGEPMSEIGKDTAESKFVEVGYSNRRGKREAGQCTPAREHGRVAYPPYWRLTLRHVTNDPGTGV